MTEQFIWVEKYRPSTIEECILPDRIKSIFLGCLAKKNVPNMMLTGSAGIGKTTVAIALCKELNINYLFINSSKERGIDVLRTKIASYASTLSLTGGKKVIILDEADYLTPEAQAGLRGMIEEFSSNCTFILTCNFKSRLIDALHSRCPSIDFTLKSDEKPGMALAFCSRVYSILKAENVNYDKKVVQNVVGKFFPDYRVILNELQKYARSGPIDVSVLNQVSDIRNINDLIQSLKNKDFTSMRKWVVLNSDIDPSYIFRKIYDSMYEYIKPEYIPQTVLIISKYLYQSSFTLDQEINLVAALTEIMVDCELV